MLRVSAVTIHRWETGKAYPNERSAYRLRQLLSREAQ